MLLARPILIRSKSEPVGCAVLVHGLDRVTRGKVMIRIPLLNQRSGIVSPLVASITLQIVAKIPRDI